MPQYRAQLCVGPALDPLGSPAPLERLDRLASLGDVVSKPLEREQECAFIVEGISMFKLGWRRQRKALFGQPVPRE